MSTINWPFESIKLSFKILDDERADEGEEDDDED